MDLDSNIKNLKIKIPSVKFIKRKKISCIKLLCCCYYSYFDVNNENDDDNDNN